MKFGFPTYGRCGVKRDLKLKPIKEFYKSVGDEITEYVGICIDEPKRLDVLHRKKNNISLLEKYNYTEDMAMTLCIEYGLLSPVYKFSKRGGCWFCPNAKLREHAEIKRLYPDVWQQFLELETETNVANKKFNPFGPTLHEINEKIKKENIVS